MKSTILSFTVAAILAAQNDARAVLGVGDIVSDPIAEEALIHKNIFDKLKYAWEQARVHGSVQASGLAIGTGLTVAGAVSSFGGSAAARAAIEGAKFAADTTNSPGRIANDFADTVSGGFPVLGPGAGQSKDLSTPPPLTPAPMGKRMTSESHPSLAAHQTAPDSFAVIDQAKGTISYHRGNIFTSQVAQAAFNSHSAKAKPDAGSPPSAKFIGWRSIRLKQMRFSAIDAITNNLVAARFWMFLAIVFAGLAVASPYFTVLAVRAKEKVVILDPGGTLIYAPLLGFEEAGQLHAYHVRLACLAFLQRNPNGPDLSDLLKRLYLDPAWKKAAALYQGQNAEFKEKQIHQKVEITEIDILDTRKIDDGAGKSYEAVTVRAEGNLIRTGTVNKLEFREPVKFAVEFLFIRNPDLLGNGRLPARGAGLQIQGEPLMKSLVQELPANDKYLAPCSCLSPDAWERPTSYGWRDSTKPNACRLPDKAGSRVRAGAFRARRASSKHDFFAPRGFVFFFGELAIRLQYHLQRIFQVLASLFQSLALSVNPWNFLYPGSPPVTHLLVRSRQLHAHIFIGFGLLVQSLAANEIAQKRLDEFVIYNLPIAFKSGNTTVLFPSAISGLYAKSVAVQEQTNADFLISFTPGNYYFTIRALKPEAKDHLTVIYNRKAYVLRLSASEKPFYAVTFFQDARPRGAARPVIPERLLSLLDKAKAYPLFQKNYPDALEGVLHATPNTTNYYDNFKLWVRDVWRFEEEDTLVFRIELENPSDTTIYSKPQDLAVRLEDRIYMQSVADASGIVPPKSTTPAFFAITGNSQGGRNNLAPDNKWNVLVVRAEGRQQLEESK